jgi:hypothetical protein
LIPLILLIITAAAPCWARDLPADGIPAEFTALEYPFVNLAGKQFRLAPGARIFNSKNHVIPPYAISGSAKVLYTLDIRGDVQNIWFLTGEETAAIENKKKSKQ